MIKKLTLLLVSVLSAVAAFAQSTVTRVDVNVGLCDNGDAMISESWMLYVDDESTEFYVDHKNLDDMDITDLNVKGYTPSGDSVDFLTVGNWDIDAEREAKTGKCGIIDIDNGKEICFGVGDSGLHTYTVTYRLTNLIKSYSDADGFGYWFIDLPSEVLVGHAKVTVEGRENVVLTSKNTRFWAFGYEGSVEMDSALHRIEAAPYGERLKGRIGIMMEFDKNLFRPTASVDDMTFDEFKNNAMKGSDFERNGDHSLPVEVIIMIFAALSFFGSTIFVFLHKQWHVYKLRKKSGIGKDVPYWRDVEKNWTIARSAATMSALSYGTGSSNGKNLVGALLLKMIHEHVVEVVNDPAENNRENLKIKVSPDSVSIDKVDSEVGRVLLGIITQAAGDDMTLQSYELGRWAKLSQNRKRMLSFYKLLQEKEADEYVIENGRKLFGLRNFLKDFSLVGERHVDEVTLWDNYLIYAELFGIADQVRRDIRKICPEYYELSSFASELEELDPMFTSIWANAIYGTTFNVHQDEVARQMAASGQGGSSSFGGGGGFSGGGGGGFR